MPNSSGDFLTLAFSFVLESSGSLLTLAFSFLDVVFRDVNRLAFTVLLNREVRRPLPIAGDWGVATRRTTGQIYPVVLSALGSNLVTVFNGGGKYIPSPEQVGRLSKFSW